MLTVLAHGRHALVRVRMEQLGHGLQRLRRLEPEPPAPQAPVRIVPLILVFVKLEGVAHPNLLLHHLLRLEEMVDIATADKLSSQPMDSSGRYVTEAAKILMKEMDATLDVIMGIAGPLTSHSVAQT